MQGFISTWVNLDRRKQSIVIFAVVGVLISMFLLAKMASKPTMQLLYSGLNADSAAEIVAFLDQEQVSYEIKGASIYVDSIQKDKLRLVLAGQGLPQNSGKGYELLDSLSGFGTTSQMFDATYWRAKEGELARTIMASPHIKSARVHIANKTSGPFDRSRSPSASVSITSRSSLISAPQATAIRHLVAAAVPGLEIESVTIVDSSGSLIGDTTASSVAHQSADKANMLREKVTRLLEARVGRGNAVVEVAVDTVTELESIREKRFDPDSRVAISTDVEERSDSSTNQNRPVTVASNLPDGDAQAESGTSAKTSLTRERVNYEVSETEHEIVKSPGDIRRLTVAVLINGLPVKLEDGQTRIEPRTEEEISSLRELVSSAVGFDPDRGDIITIKSMELPNLEQAGTTGDEGLLARFPIDPLSLIQLFFFSLVSLVLGLFVVRPIMLKGDQAPLAPLVELANPLSPENSSATLKDANSPDEADNKLAGQVAEQTLSLPKADRAAELENPVDRLRNMIGARQSDSVEILRSWLEEEREKAV